MKFLDLDHNCQELIASAMKTHGEIENYAIATHNNELLEQNLKNHVIEIEKIYVDYVIHEIFEDENDDKSGLGLYITKEGIKFDDKFIKIYDVNINKKYIICKKILFVFYNKTVDFFIYQDNKNIIINTFYFDNFIRKVDLKRLLIKLESDENYLIYSNDKFNFVDFYKQINKHKHTRIFVKDDKIIRIIGKNYNISRCNPEHIYSSHAYSNFFYSLINLFYDPSRDHKILIEIFNYFYNNHFAEDHLDGRYCGDMGIGWIKFFDLLNDYKQSKNSPVVIN
jgi:hypothetical protein